MLDYLGSVVLSKEEIDSKIINKYRDSCNEEYIQKIINDLRKEKVILCEYSISGWNMFHRRPIFDIITKTIDYQKQLNEFKLKMVYYLQTYFKVNNIKDYDIIEYIANKKWEVEDLKK